MNTKRVRIVKAAMGWVYIEFASGDMYESLAKDVEEFCALHVLKYKTDGSASHGVYTFPIWHMDGYLRQTLKFYLVDKGYEVLDYLNPEHLPVLSNRD